MPDVLQQVKNLLERPGGIGALPGEVEELSYNIIGESALVAEAAFAEVDTGILVALAGLLDAFGGWFVLLVVVLVLAVLKILEWSLVAILHKLPMGLGTTPAAVVVAIFSPIDTAEQWCLDRATDIVSGIMHAWVDAIKATVQLAFPNIGHITGTSVSPDTTALQNEILHIEHTLTTLQSEISQLQHNTGQTVNVTVDDVPLHQRVVQLETLAQVLIHDIQVIYNETQMQTATITHVESELASLQASLHDVRAVEVGWAEILNTLETVQGQLQTQVADTETRTAGNTQALTLLHPLTVLLGGGVAGLRTLRSLEDRPCQCPTFPGMPHGLGDALALYEIVTNG